jgi:MFS family permease
MVGIGTGIGPILSRYFTHDDDRLMRLWMVAGYVVTSVGMVTVAMLGVFPLTLGGVLLRGLGVAITWVFSTQILLQTLPGDVRGRVFGTEFAMVTLMNAFGAGFGGWLLDSALVTIPQMLWGMATLNLLLCALWVWLGLLRPAGPLVLVEEETPS